MVPRMPGGREVPCMTLVSVGIDCHDGFHLCLPMRNSCACLAILRLFSGSDSTGGCIARDLSLDISSFSFSSLLKLSDSHLLRLLLVDRCGVKREGYIVDIRRQIFLFLGIDEWIHKLHCHLLACRRAEESSLDVTSGTICSFHFRLLDVASDVENVHIVDIFQIVFKVQLIEPQGDPEGGIFWWKMWCTHQRNYKVWPSIWSMSLLEA